MLRFICLSLLGLALLAETASAQTKPAKAKTATRSVSNQTAAARKADPLRGTNDNGAGQAGYAAPGEPIQVPGSGGKNTANYDGQPAHPAKSNTTIVTPK
ncbi:MAG: hypothetical protein EOO36_14330 [Cytophagaceae bacterium]|nr:MAG: hypothetical protein EOO36_14330 [Cytophagaceae bacterium]